MISFIHPYFLMLGALCAWVYLGLSAPSIFSKSQWPLALSMVSHSAWAVFALTRHLEWLRLSEFDFLQALFLGLPFALYAVSLIRYIFQEQLNDKLERLLVKLALLYGLILMTLANLIHVNTAFLVYVGSFLLLTLWIHHTELLKFIFYKHMIGLLCIFLCLVLGYNQIIDETLIWYLQNFFLLVTLLIQIKLIQAVQR
jgi:hypothetical protein